MNAAEMYAVLQQMTADLPDRPDRRSAEQVERDAALEQAAEYRQWARRNPSDSESMYAARRYSA